MKIDGKTTLGELQLEAQRLGIEYIGAKQFPAHERVLVAVQSHDLEFVTSEAETLAEALEIAFRRVEAREGVIIANRPADSLPPTEN